MDLKQIDAFGRLGKQYNLDPALVGAVIMTESSGQALVDVGGQMVPIIRWEGHYFDKYVPTHLREEARKLKLASPKAGGIKNPEDQAARYSLLHRAMKLDAAAALMSISIGIGQVMGAHYKALGFATPQEMFEYNCQGYDAQADVMMRYNVAFDLVDELERHDFTGFARGYNGKNFAKGGYHLTLKRWFETLSGKAPVVKADGMLRMGSQGRAVRELQQLLVRAGYSLNIDADFGPSTKKALKAFQTEKGLTVDGVAGPETMEALSAFRQDGEDLTKPDLRKTIDGVVVAVGGPAGVEVAKKTVEEAAKQVTSYGLPEIVSTGLLWVAGVLVVVGIGMSAYQFLKARKWA